LARELSLREISEIRYSVSAEVELFVHGALCISYSGRCLLSLYLTGRDANQGDCAHPCRYLYRLEEEKRPGQFFPVEEDGRGTYLFNSKDLCLLHRLSDLIDAGADSLKIEGRMKSVYYVGAIVRLYRAALDFFSALPENVSGKEGRPALPPSFQEELEKIGSRGYTENFLESPPGSEDMLYEGARVRQAYAPVGIIRQENPALVEIRNPLNTGDRIEYLDQGLVNIPCTIKEIRDPEGNVRSRANPNSLVYLQTDPPSVAWKINGLLRKETAP
jgi:putative protease